MLLSCWRVVTPTQLLFPTHLLLRCGVAINHITVFCFKETLGKYRVTTQIYLISPIYNVLPEKYVCRKYWREYVVLTASFKMKLFSSSSPLRYEILIRTYYYVVLLPTNVFLTNFAISYLVIYLVSTLFDTFLHIYIIICQQHAFWYSLYCF